ncbi:MAG: dihydropteroate synthase [Chromatiales bacterium]|jgi:dihydropteroate synthase|nr:dihydropteroate synthase [Chromatiales bacterium]
MLTIPCRRRPLPLDRARVMGVLNVTPDSFSDGGRFTSVAEAVAAALALAGEGADIVDVGGESTRPGARPVPVADELARVVPVVAGLRRASDVLISVDTSEPAVMESAVAAGADLINDVRALRRPGALAAAARLQVPVVLMHMQGEPATMQQAPAYDDVVAEVLAFLADRIAACITAGLARASLIIDPGFGFGKRPADNLALLEGLHRFRALGVPLLAGLSRKSLIGHLTGAAIAERRGGSIALALAARAKGADILRVHDVADTVQALAVAAALGEN